MDNNFQQYVKTRRLAEILYENNIDLQPYLSQIESGNYDEEQIVSEIMGTLGNAIGGVAGNVASGIKNFAQGVKSGYTAANPQQANPQQANPQQANPQQANPQQANPQQAKARQDAVNKVQATLKSFQTLIPQFDQQIKALASF